MKVICPDFGKISCTNRSKCIHGYPHDKTNLCDYDCRDGGGRYCPKCIEVEVEDIFIKESEMNL